MATKKEPGKGLISKIRSNRVATVNNRKGSGKFEDYGVQRKGNPIKMTSERTKEGKNIFGKKVVKDRRVDPGKDGTFSVRTQKMTYPESGSGTKTKIKVKTYDSTGKRIATGKAKMTSTSLGYNTKEKLRDKEGKSVIIKKSTGGGRSQVKRATGKFKDGPFGLSR